MAKYSTFQYGDGTKYGSGPTGGTGGNLRWTFIVAWDGYYSWGNEAEQMIGLTVKRGRKSLLDKNGLAPFGIGEAVVTLDNSDGRYDPWNTSSPLYPNVKPGKFIRLAVLDADLGDNYGVMRGKIDDIVCLTRSKQRIATIKIIDGFSWLTNRTINRGLTASVEKSTNIVRIKDQAEFPTTEWGTDITTTSDTQSYWWAWNQNALEALHEFNRAEWAISFHSRLGTWVWRPRSYTHYRTKVVDESELLKDIGRPNPWEVVRNKIRVKSQPKELNECNAILWQLRGTPEIANGETLYIEALFSYLSYTPCGSGVTIDHTVNAQADGGGADLTASCDLTYDSDIGEGARIWITNRSGSTGYITLLKCTGDAIYAPSADIREAEDTTSQNDYGIKSLDIDSRWIEDTEYAQTLADWLLSELKDPSASPIIQIENRSAIQFYLDLYDRVELTCATLGISGNFRVGHIEHQWLTENGQAVRTTFRLEPYMVQT